MSREEQVSSSRHAAGSRRRRRRRLARLFLGDPYEQATEYPGFFVLPRAKPRMGSAAESQPSHARWEQFKRSAVLLLALGGFVAALAYFFYQAGRSSTTLEKDPPADVDQPRAPF